MSIKNITGRWMTLLVLVSAAWVSPVSAQTAGRIIAGEGVIQSLDFARNQMVINGIVYDVATDAEVQIRGTYGAFTMLQVGMKASFEFEEFSMTERTIRALDQLPDNHQLTES